jgi:hypothetical protein
MTFSTLINYRKEAGTDLNYRPQYAIIKIAPAVPSIVGSLVE